MLFCPFSNGKVIYVDDDAAGANDGTNWTDAYHYLQDALTDANDSEKPVEIRVAQGIYLPMGSVISVENVASQLYIPNYLSFESALTKYGILNLIPYTLTFATTRKTKKYTLRKQKIEFRQISPELFFGFEMKNGIYIASPEKAFLDQVYFATRGKARLDFDELDIKKLSMKSLKELSRKFPAYVRSFLNNITKPIVKN